MKYVLTGDELPNYHGKSRIDEEWIDDVPEVVNEEIIVPDIEDIPVPEVPLSIDSIPHGVGCNPVAYEGKHVHLADPSRRGRKPIGDKAMTSAERKALWKKRHGENSSMKEREYVANYRKRKSGKGYQE